MISSASKFKRTSSLNESDKSYVQEARTTLELQMCLGANIKKYNFTDDEVFNSEHWDMVSELYAIEAMWTTEALMAKHNFLYPYTRHHGSSSPFTNSRYRLELDHSDLYY